MNRLEFHVADYAVMIIFILVSSLIGLYYGFIKKQTTTEEYILGNRQMHPIPIALSLAVTFQSAVSILGAPSEIYLYNTMATFYGFFSTPFIYLVQAFIIVPLVHPLKLTSAFEYLERRFQSKAVQLLGMAMGMLQTLMYISIVLYSPALALEAVAGIPLWLSIVLIGVIGTFYTAIGGMKTVVWTDTFQFVMLYGGLTAILVLGVKEIGSLSTVFDLASKGDRLKINEISIDPRVRHTVWGCTIGNWFSTLSICFNQASIQRISSVKKEREAKMATLLNIPFGMIFSIVLSFTGLVLYAYFATKACDPIKSGQLSNANQLIIYFVMTVFNDIPGLAGIFLAAIFSGALSSLSSGINSMATNTIQDILGNYLKDALQVKKTFIAKLCVFVYGILCVILAYLSKFLTGPVTQMANTAFGAAGGPVVGIFVLGFVFPQANKKGALVGGLCGIAINMWIALGSFLYGNKAPVSPAISTSGCLQNSTDSMMINGTFLDGNFSSTIISHPYDIYRNETTTVNIQAEADVDTHLVLYDLSYIWFGLTGFLISVILGLIVSFITGKDKDHPTSPIYIVPFLRNVWTFDESVAHDNTEMATIKSSDLEKEIEVTQNDKGKSD